MSLKQSSKLYHFQGFIFIGKRLKIDWIGRFSIKFGKLKLAFRKCFTEHLLFIYIV